MADSIYLSIYLSIYQRCVSVSTIESIIIWSLAAFSVLIDGTTGGLKSFISWQQRYKDSPVTLKCAQDFSSWRRSIHTAHYQIDMTLQLVILIILSALVILSLMVKKKKKKKGLEITTNAKQRVDKQTEFAGHR